VIPSFVRKVKRNELTSWTRRQGVRSIVISVASYAPKAIGVVVAGRALSAAQLGIYGVLTSAIAVASLAMPFSSYVARSRPGTGGIVTGRESSAVTLDLLACALIASVGLLSPTRQALLSIAGTSIAPSTHTLAVLLFAASAIATVGQAWLQSDFRYVASALLATVPDVAWLVPFGLLAWFGGVGVNELFAARLSVMAIAAAIAIALIPWRRMAAAPPTLRDARTVTAYAAPLAVVSGSLTVLMVADRVVLPRYVSIQQVGRYTFMYLVLSTATTIGYAVARVATTSATGQANGGHWSAARRTLRLAGLGGMVLPVAAGFVLVATGPIVNLLVGKPLLPSAATVVFSGLGIGLLVGRVLWQAWFRLHYATRMVAGIEVLVLGFYAILLVALAGRYGVVGAAIAMVGANALGMLLYWAATLRLARRSRAVPSQET
jgi:O-antigen/teichoic acid export membrane protein